ncbi:sorbin and SH3 domain-containing protein 1 isoform X1, partial [Clarias magur]
MDCFEHWNTWRKLDSEDEPALYVSTVCGVIEEENIAHLEDEVTSDNRFPSPVGIMDLPDPEELPQPPSDQFYLPEEDVDVSDGTLTQPRSLSDSEEHKTYLTVQPNRILCGTQVDIYVVMVNKLDIRDSIEVEFCCERSTKRVSGTAVNEYIVTVQSPDMPTGEVTLHLYSNGSILCSTTVTYYTEMEEISNYLEKVMDPVHFMCQAFSITSNAPEALDNLLTDSLKKQMPPNGLKAFGINQLEEGNTNQRDMELPTLLHFSAKHGLKKLTSTLLQCPGALQAYSIANKHGDYPNTLAERNGFPDLRQFMDDYVETIDLVKSHIEESMDTPVDEDIYEPMANASQNFVAKFSLQEDIYESMMQLNPDMQLYEDLSSLNSSFNESQSEEAVLRKFFEANAKTRFESEEEAVNDACSDRRFSETEEETTGDNMENYEEDDEEDPYKLCYPDEIYDTIDDEESISPAVMNRPPAPIPRTCPTSEPEECKTYISTVFSSKNSLYSETNQSLQVRPVPERTLSIAHDPYAGMKTPGQRQLISLQERVKVGALTVEEAVQEFKAWQFDQEKRSQSVRFQQGSPAGGTVRFDAAPARPLINSPRSVSAVRITPLRTMKSSPDLMPTELDPTRVCKGKGAVTLRATLVHVDDGDCITQEQVVNPDRSECHRAVNGDATETTLAEEKLNSIGADLNSDQVYKATTQVEYPISLGLSDFPSAATVPSVSTPDSSVYPSIVLLQHSTDAVEQRDRVYDQGSTETQICLPPEDPQRFSTQMDGRRMMITVHPATPVPLEKPRVPVRNTEKSKDWYKNMFKQIHRVPETVEENPYRPTYIFPESYDRLLNTRDDSSSHMDDYGRSVPRSKSAVDMGSSQSRRRVSMPTRTSSLRPEGNEWEPPDKKVDTRKYRAEPRSIFDYEPGKSSVLRAERPDLTSEDVDLENEPWYRFYSEMEFGKTSAPSFTPLETASDLQQYPACKPGPSVAAKESSSADAGHAAPECDRHIYKSVLEGGDIPLQGLRALNKRHPSTSSKDSESSQPLSQGDQGENPDEVARRRYGDKEKILEEQRRLKREQEEADIASRRHAGLVLTHQQFITNERFGDLLTINDTEKRKSGPERTPALALFNFKAETLKELPFQKGDIVYIVRQVDQNWYEGEHHGRVGIFPRNYVELLPPTEKAQPKKSAPVQVLEYGEAIARFNFTGDTAVEMSFRK